MVKLMAVLLGGVVLAGSIGSQGMHPNRPPECKRGPEHHEMFLRLKEKLDLSAEQQERLRSIRIEHRRSEIEIKARLATSRLDLMEMLRDVTINRSRIEEKVKDIGRVRTEMGLSRIDGILKTRDVLTPEQLEKLVELDFPIMKLLPPGKVMRSHR